MKLNIDQDNIKFIENCFEQQAQGSTFSTEKINALKKIINTVFQLLESGKIRAAEKIDHEWVTHIWIKQAILLSFKLFPNEIIPAQYTQFYDKVRLKHQYYTAQDFEQANIRSVPGAIVRSGSYIGSQTVLMPSFTNIGAYIDSGCMIDTWATVGSCAQIGKNVHISGGAGIGGVLEPLQANPTIIEDNCFIGARSEIVEGVIIEEGAVISMGVYIGQSTRIYNRLTQEISYGRVPKNAVVVPGALPAKDNSHSLYCAVIIKFADHKTLNKIQLNELLRD